MSFEIKSSLSNLANLTEQSPNERAVAEIVLADPEQSALLSIARLFTTAGVSDLTVNRFYQSFPYRGFPDFKPCLAQTLANPANFEARSLQDNDSNL